MPRRDSLLRGRWRRLAGGAIVAAVLASLTLPGAAAARGPLDTAIADVFYSDVPLRMHRVHQSGATTVRLFISWRGVAPPTKPASFDPTNPGDPNYDWREVDDQVARAVAEHLRPIFSVTTAPSWAEGSSAGLPPGERDPGTVRPNATELGKFMLAAARRYSGHFGGLPRVRMYQAWNEPSHSHSLNPQFDLGPNTRATPTSRMLSPDIYRPMLANVSSSVHSVDPTNVVIGGGLAPFFRSNPGGRVSAPLRFMRQLLCISGRNRPLSGCPQLNFDVWAVHPYTSGGPTHHARSRYDVSLGDLPEVRRVLRAAIRARHVVSRRKMRMWITEFSWDSKPPDRYGLPVKLEARWVAEALYRTWKGGIGLFTWYSIRDDPRDQVFQAGLWFRCAGGLTCDRPKPALAAFRFPFVAFKAGRRVLVWGRTPFGKRGSVIVERRSGRGWRRVAGLRTNSHGIFSKRLRTAGRGVLRARLRRGARSNPFSLKRVRDRPVNPFGNAPVDEG